MNLDQQSPGSDFNGSPQDNQGPPCVTPSCLTGVGGVGGPPTTGPEVRPQAASEAVSGCSHGPTATPPFLDIMSHNGTLDMEGHRPTAQEIPTKERRQRARVFHRLVTGMYYHRNEQFRFLTLTSGQHSPVMRDSWKELIKRIRRTTPAHLLEGGYLVFDDLDKYKPGDLVEPLRFEYFVVFTSEGLGVAHCVYAGSYIPFTWLRDQWVSIHNAYGVIIKKVRPYQRKRNKSQHRSVPTGDKVYYPPGLAGYMLNQYLRGQSAIRTINHSRGWVYPGFVDDWTRVKRKHKGEPINDLVKAWHAFLDQVKVPQYDLDNQVISNKRKYY